MIKATYILFCQVGFALSYMAPERYNYDFCQLVLVLFIVTNVFHFLVTKNANKNSANFELDCKRLIDFYSNSSV